MIAAFLAGFGVEVCCALSPDVCCGGTPICAPAAPSTDDADDCGSCCESQPSPPASASVEDRNDPPVDMPLTDCGCERDLGRIAEAARSAMIEPPPALVVCELVSSWTSAERVLPSGEGRPPPDSHRIPLRV